MIHVICYILELSNHRTIKFGDRRYKTSVLSHGTQLQSVAIVVQAKPNTLMLNELLLSLELCKDGLDAGWRKFGFYETFSLTTENIEENIERVDGRTVTDEQFIKAYESTYTPCVITHLMESWPAIENWTLRVCLQQLNMCLMIY